MTIPEQLREEAAKYGERAVETGHLTPELAAERVRTYRALSARSERAKDWYAFSDAVVQHIDAYTVPQYGDKGADQASDYTAEGHVQQARKYLARFGRSSRPGEERLDLMKAAHYLQMAWMEMGNEAGATAGEAVREGTATEESQRGQTKSSGGGVGEHPTD